MEQIYLLSVNGHYLEPLNSELHFQMWNNFRARSEQSNICAVPEMRLRQSVINFATLRHHLKQLKNECQIFNLPVGSTFPYIWITLV